MYRDWWRRGARRWRRYPEGGIPSPGTETFLTVQRFEGSEPREGEPHLAPLYFDFDAGKGGLSEVAQEALTLVGHLEEFFGLPPEAMHLHYTGGRGIHLEVAEQALGARPSPDLTYAYKFWARDLARHLGLSTLDLAVYSCRRMWRQVGSRHGKTGLYKVPIAWQDLAEGPERLRRLARRRRPALPYPEADLVPAAAEALECYLQSYRRRQAEVRQAPVVIPAGYVPPCVDHLLRRFWPKPGQSNRALMVLATWMWVSGMGRPQAERMAAAWLEEAPEGLFNSPPRSPWQEAAKVVRCVYENPQRYFFGCRFARALGLCSGRCRLL
jgi:hypothetical protein